MKQNNILTFALVALVIIALIIMGYFFIKPNYSNIDQNPYALKIDSLGEIPTDKYCQTTYRFIQLEGKKSAAIAIDQHNNMYVAVDNKIYCMNDVGEIRSVIQTKSEATALTCTGDSIIAAFTNEISIFNPLGTVIAHWKLSNPKSYISSLTTLENKIYAADAQFAQVYGFSKNGKLHETIGQRADKKELSFFAVPSFYFDVATGNDNTLWVANTGRHKLVQFDNEKEIKSSWGFSSSALEGFCGCCNPSNFAIMSDGSFVTSEKGLVRIKKHNQNGNFQCAIAGPERFMENAKGLDIAIDSEDKIFVLEPDAMKIHIFELN